MFFLLLNQRNKRLTLICSQVIDYLFCFRLASMKNQLLKDKSFTEKKISSQTEILLSLKPSLAGILNATMPLQEQLHLKIDENKVQFEIAAFLPK